jgi:flagellar basal-body rod protein FlgC
LNLFGVMDISASALRAERVRAEVVAANMANAETTRTTDGTPYQRHHVLFAAADQGLFQNAITAHVSQPNMSSATFTSSNITAAVPAGGVSVVGVIQDLGAPLKRYEPGHPDADSEGFVAYPDINPLTEMVDLMGATRSYGMNASAVQAEKAMVSTSFDLVK